MPAATVEAPRHEIARPPVRIRTVLAVGLVFAGGWWAYPRALAAWQLHTAATTLADYGLCMVGPTGPSLLRDNPPEFRRLVRRRLVAAGADERPFERCAKAARELTGSAEVARAHRATAWSFVEYGGAAAEHRGALGVFELDDLRVTTRPVAELAKHAWPFAHGYTKLVKPSLSAYEAVHPVELPRPGIGRGLPAWRARYRTVRRTRDGKLLLAVGRAANLSVYRSDDDGVDWTPAPVRSGGVAGFAGRCSGQGSEHSFSFGLSDDGRRTAVTSFGPDGAPETVDLAPSNQSVFAAACDDQALVAAISPHRSRDVTLLFCPYRDACHPMALPRFRGVGAQPRYPLDIARMHGTTILAVTMHGIVRVASTRDDGKSWTPFTVAYDEGAHPGARARVKVPGRLLAIGKRVLLYGGSPQPSWTYSVLASDDDGAAWRRP
jgi:hypothetical protein